MKLSVSVILFSFLIGLYIPAYGQGRDSFINLLQKAQPDTNKVKLLLDFGEMYYFTNPDSCLILSDQALELARELNFESGKVAALNKAGESLRFLGEYPRALEMQYNALEMNKAEHDIEGEAHSSSFIGFTYVEFGEYAQGLKFLFSALEMHQRFSDKTRICFDLSNIGNAYELINKLDSALFFQQKAYLMSGDLSIAPLKALTLARLGNIYFRMGNYTTALVHYHNALLFSKLYGENVNPSKIESQIASSYLAENQDDSSLYYAQIAFSSGRRTSQKLQILNASNLLVKLFRKKSMSDSIIYYQDVANTTKDSLFGPEKLRQLQLLMLRQQQQQQQFENREQQYKNKVKTSALLLLLGFILVIAIILFRNNYHKQKVNRRLEKTLSDLKSAQAQLIQSEKMASLGELTAGVAHEIQNPLNFINNFSEVNKELIDEMEQEIDKGSTENLRSIASDIKKNEEKIIHHGKRADAIVKGMLQHSRKSTGQLVPTDINALADEYLLLAYHGLRAKDKSFNVTIQTNFDPIIGSISMIPQDIGRVLLNLYNNAFYAVNEKKNQQPEGYEPTVSVSTEKTGDKVEIRVKDNGIGIPQKVVDKIFQPFFTTKPPGQGTGLGLSLSYDTIKAHGGAINVETNEGQGAEFVIQIPAG